MEQPKVLLVEDNRVLRSWMQLALREAGFSVWVTDTVEEAKRLCARYPFDVLITDWHLPEAHDGFEVLIHLREKRPKVLAVLVSAEADPQLVEHGWEAGFDLVLRKPVRVPEIVGAVYSLLKRQREGVINEAARRNASYPVW